MRAFGTCLAALLISLATLQPSAAAPGGDGATPQPIDLRAIGAPPFANFSSRDGLPDSVAVSIRTDRDGFVWAGSPKGLYRYDGRRWVAEADRGLAHFVDSLWTDHEGTLWAAFRGHGLARHDGTRWHHEDEHSGLPSQRIRRFFETRDAQGHHTLWALTWDQGLMFRARDGRWRSDPGNDSLPRGAILSMAQTQSLGAPRRQWVGTGSAGLWYRDEGQVEWSKWQAPGLDSAQVEYLLATGRGNRESLWMSVFNVGLWQLSGTGVRRWSVESGELPTNELYDMAATRLPDGDPVLWISSRSGLLRMQSGRARALDRRHGLASNVVRAMHAWRSPGGQDVLWLATEAGVSRTLPGASPWTTASLMGAQSVGVFGVLVEPDGRGSQRLWVGASEDGLGLYESGHWRHFTAAAGQLPAGSVTLVKATGGPDRPRRRWLGLRGGELLRIDDGAAGPTFTPLATPWPKATGQAVLDILSRTVDGQEEVWVATRQSGAHRLVGRRWDAPRPESVATHEDWRVVALVTQRDAAGRDWLWASTDRGLARFDGTRWRLFDRSNGLPDDALLGLSLIPDDRGRPVLWVGTTHAGVARIDVGDPRRPRVLADTLPPPPDPTVYSALPDGAGRIHVCTNSGVQHLVADGTGFRSTVSTRSDGMVHDECNTNAQFVDDRNRYWVGTLGGLSVYDPSVAPRDPGPKPLRLTGVRVDGRDMPVGQAPSPVTVPPDGRTVDVDFALLAWHREAESRFRTQLLGFEDKPGPWGPESARTFNALPPGRYRLHVEAVDHAGVASAPLQVPIIVPAAWWQQPAARVAAALTLLLLALAILKWRTRTLQVQRDDLEHRVAARTAELDRANARLVELSYVDALTGLANRRRLLERLERPAGATRDPTPTALLLVDVDHFKDYNDRFGHPAGDEALRAVAQSMLACAPAGALVARYGGEEFACLVPSTDLETARTVAECMRREVAERDIAIPGETMQMRVTVSAGVASARLASPDDPHRLLREADAALYQAKRDGRNRVRP